MFRVLTVEHDWRLVVIAGVVCFIASHCVISLFHRARASQGRTSATWILIAGLAAGCGIGATHFIAMLAYGVGTSYDVGLTVVAFVVAVAVTCGGLGAAIHIPVRGAVAAGGGHRGRRGCRDALSRNVGAGIARPHNLVA